MRIVLIVVNEGYAKYLRLLPSIAALRGGCGFREPFSSPLYGREQQGGRNPKCIGALCGPMGNGDILLYYYHAQGGGGGGLCVHFHCKLAMRDWDPSLYYHSAGIKRQGETRCMAALHGGMHNWHLSMPRRTTHGIRKWRCFSALSGHLLCNYIGVS